MASYDWPAEGGSGGTVTVAAFGSTPNASGADITNSVLTLEPADATHPGGVSTTTQTLAGNKTFSGTVQSPANYHVEAAENNAGNSSTAQTINWATASAQLSTLTGSVTYTFTNPVAGGSYLLRVATGVGSFTATWPVTVKWPGGTTPTVTATGSKIDIFSFYYDGTNFYGNFAQNY